MGAKTPQEGCEAAVGSGLFSLTSIRLLRQNCSGNVPTVLSSTHCPSSRTSTVQRYADDPRNVTLRRHNPENPNAKHFSASSSLEKCSCHPSYPTVSMCSENQTENPPGFGGSTVIVAILAVK